MARMEYAMEINAPVHVVYDQLLRFEEYPRFMESVRAVRRIDGRHLHWHAQAGDQNLEWDIEITQQVPGRLIAWCKPGEARLEGRIELEKTGVPRGYGERDEFRDGQFASAEHTRLRLIMDCDAADGVAYSQMMAHRAGHDLARFKKCVESQASGLHTVQPAPQRAMDGGPGMTPAPSEAASVASVAYRRRRKVEEMGPGPLLDLRPPWLPAFLPAWENPLRIMRRVSQGMDKIVDGVMAGARLDAHRAASSASSASSANDAYRNGGAWSPLVEVTRSDDGIVVQAELAGVRREDVQIDIRADRLMIEGDRRPQQPNHPGEARRSERSYGHFYRVVDLPLGADPEAATASMRDGLLEVRVPVRRAAAECRRLDIQAPE